MRKVSVEVMYVGQADSKLDKRIEDTAKKIGCTGWTGGYDSGFRDICFDLEVPPKWTDEIIKALFTGMTKGGIVVVNTG